MNSLDKLAQDGGSVVIKKKRKTEFSKKLAVWCVVIATLAAAASYGLAALGLEPTAEVTVCIFTACTGYLIAYAGKSLGEKVSRNRHGVDRDGEFINNNNAEG